MHVSVVFWNLHLVSRIYEGLNIVFEVFIEQPELSDQGSKNQKNLKYSSFFMILVFNHRYVNSYFEKKYIGTLLQRDLT